MDHRSVKIGDKLLFQSTNGQWNKARKIGHSIRAGTLLCLGADSFFISDKQWAEMDREGRIKLDNGLERARKRL